MLFSVIVGGEALLIHPDYLIAALDGSTYAAYTQAYAKRSNDIYHKFNNAFVSRNLIQLKETPPVCVYH